MKLRLLIIFFMDSEFGVVSKMSSPNPGASIIYPMLLFRSFIILHFPFQLVIYCDLFFVKDIWSMSRFFFFSCECPFVPSPFVEKNIFAPLISFAYLSMIS